MWSVHAMEYYSARKTNKVLKRVITEANLKDMVNERSQPQKAIYDCTRAKCLEELNPVRQKADWWLPGVMGNVEWRTTA